MSRALVLCLTAASLLTTAPPVRAQSELPAEAAPADRGSVEAGAGGEIDRYEPEATELERYLKESARELEAKHRLVNTLLLTFGGALVLFMLAVLWMAVRGRRSARRAEAQIEELLATNRRVAELLQTLVDRKDGGNTV